MNLYNALRPLSAKAYEFLVQQAMVQKTVSAEDIIKHLNVSIRSDDVSDTLNTILTHIDSFDVKHDRPRVTVLVVKRKQNIPIRKWFTKHFELYEGLSPEDADAKSFSMSLGERKALWEQELQKTYDYWDIGNA